MSPQIVDINSKGMQVSQGGHFRLDHKPPIVTVICTTCEQEIGRFAEPEILMHALTGRQYECPRCDAPAPACASMSAEQLVKLHDSIFAHAQEIMRTNDEVLPIAFVCTTRRRALDAAEKARNWGFLAPDGMKPGETLDDVIQLAVPMHHDPELLFGYICILIPEQEAMLKALLAIGKAAKVRDVYLHTVRPVMQLLEMDCKDILASIVHKLAEDTQAFAVINVSEALTVDGVGDYDPAKHARVLADDPNAREVIMCSLNTHAFTRMRTIEIIRREGSPRGEGKVIGFGAEDLADSRHDGERLVGRMVDFLAPLDA